jgi:hypothetical protein
MIPTTVRGFRYLDGAESVTVPRRLYSWSRWTVECLRGLGGRSRCGGNRLNAALLVVGEDGHRTFRFGQSPHARRGHAKRHRFRGSINQNPGYKLRCELGYIDFIGAKKDK